MLDQNNPQSKKNSAAAATLAAGMKDMKQSKLLFKKDQISLYVIILYGLLYFTMFMVILLDRRDPLPLRDDRANLVVNDLAQQFGMPA